jgi:molybdopterin-containing oxidoreductase family iron-sulfur binding subunit
MWIRKCPANQVRKYSEFAPELGALPQEPARSRQKQAQNCGTEIAYLRGLGTGVSMNSDNVGGRRRFLRACSSFASGIAAFLAGRKLAPPVAVAGSTPPLLAEDSSNDLVRMQQDLEAALSRPGRSWVVLVDTRKCVGCQACVVACRAENMTGPAGSYRRVVQVARLDLGTPSAVFKPVNCLQCDKPPCAGAVPPGMITKRPDGIVEFDYTRLKGAYARAAAAACPYGAIHADDGKRYTAGTPAPQAYEKREFTEYGRVWNRGEGTPLAETARKCHFCSQLLDASILPACVTTCVGRAMYFGDASNPDTLVSRLMKAWRVSRMHADAGVGPRVFYVDERLPGASQTDCTVCHY